MKNVLVIIDMQKNFISDCKARRIVPAVAEKIKQRIADGYEIMLTVDKSGGKTAPPVLRTCRGCKVFHKHTYGSEELILALKELQPASVEFVGVCTDICVVCNVLAAKVFLPNARITVDSACCASFDGGNSAALQVMKSCNVTVV